MKRDGALGGVGFFLHHTGDGRIRLITGYSLRAVEAVIELVPLVVLYLTLDALLAGASDSTFVVSTAAVALGLALTLRVGVGLMAERLIMTEGVTSIRNTRAALVDKVRTLPMGDLHGPAYREFNALVGRDVVLLEMLPTQVFPAIIWSLTSIVGLTALLVWLDLMLTFALGALFLLAFFCFRFAHKQIFSLNRERSAAIGELTFRVTEFARGIRIFRAFRSEGHERQELEYALERYRQSNTALTRKLVPPMMAQALILESAPVVVLGASVLTYDGSTGALALLAFFVIAGFRLADLLRRLSASLDINEGARAAVERVQSLMDRPALPEPLSPATPKNARIDLKQAHFAPGGSLVLAPTDLTIEPGTTVAIVGRSGAGKSSLLRLIARYWDLTSGHIELGGADLRDIGSTGLQQQISIATQDVMVFGTSLYENVAIGDPKAPSETVISAAELCACDDIGAMSMGDAHAQVRIDGASISGGERQRVALARAVLKQAPVLLLDEVTAALDAATERKVMEKLYSQVFPGRTVLMVAHRLTTVTEADRILVMDQGRIVQDGTHATLYASNGLYRDLWRTN